MNTDDLSCDHANTMKEVSYQEQFARRFGEQPHPLSGNYADIAQHVATLIENARASEGSRFRDVTQDVER